MNRQLACAGVALATAIGFGFCAANAATVLQTANSGGAGNQIFSGVGLEFTVNSPITVSALGFYDVGLGVITGPLTADLMTAGGSILASQTFTNASGSLVNGGYLFESISPVVLAAGNYYLMGYGPQDYTWEHNSFFDNIPDTFDTGGGAVSFVQSVWGGGSDPAGTPPSSFPGPSNPNFFSSANMQFSAAVPEPTTWALVLIGFGGIGGALRSRSRAATG